tara:strand:+ start:185 stop:436 length:252 start_codon:yes stop_codon:yes gene_type:complete
MAQQLSPLATSIYNGCSIQFSASKAIARYQLLTQYGDWSGDYTERVFDSKARAIKFLKNKSKEQAEILMEAQSVEDEKQREVL